MKKLSYVMLTPLLIAALSGCGSKKNSAQDIVNAVAKDASLLLNTEGAPVYADTTTQMYAGDFFLALNKFEYNDKTTVDITWTLDDDTKWTTKEYAADTTRTMISPIEIYDKSEAFKGTLTATATYGGKSASAKFYGYVNELSVQTLSIKEYREKFDAEEVTGADNVKFYGYITGTMEANDTHLYAGVFVNSGEYGLMLYAGNLAAHYLGNGLKIGDLVMCVGYASPYNGLFEVKPRILNKVDISEVPVGYDLSNPTRIDIAPDEYNNTDLHLRDGALITLDNLVYLGAGNSDSSPDDGNSELETGNVHQYMWFYEEMDVVYGFLNEGKLYKVRTIVDAEAEEATYTYSEEITLLEGELFFDADEGQFYRQGADEYSEIDMGPYFSIKKGWMVDGSFYTKRAMDEETGEWKYSRKQTAKYGSIYVDKATSVIYLHVAGDLVAIDLDQSNTYQTVVACYINYHQGKTMQKSLASMIEDWVVGETVVDYDGWLSWFNGPNLAPMQGADCFTKVS